MKSYTMNSKLKKKTSCVFHIQQSEYTEPQIQKTLYSFVIPFLVIRHVDIIIPPVGGLANLT